MKRSLAHVCVVLAAFAYAASASAHAELSPSVVLKEHSQVFTLAVPTEVEDVTTTKVELTPPEGFSIDSFVPSLGWKRDAQQTGSGEDAVVTKVTWDGGKVPTGEDAAFSFLGRPDSSQTYTFAVRQTYSDGSVVDWSGAESSDAPAPTVEAKDSFGGGNSLVSVIALVVGGLALALAVAALVAGTGRRSLA